MGRTEDGAARLPEAVAARLERLAPTQRAAATAPPAGKCDGRLGGPRRTTQPSVLTCAPSVSENARPPGSRQVLGFAAPPRDGCAFVASAVADVWAEARPHPHPTVHDCVVLRSCEQCGAPFELAPGAHKRRFCSRLCRRRTWEAARAATFRASRERQPKVCDHCGQTFTSPWAKTRYCSATCHVDHRLAQLRAARLAKVAGRLCKHCGRPVPETRRLNARYCDGYCKAQALRAHVGTSHRHKAPAGTYEALLAAQGGRCAICGTDTPGTIQRFFALDHDHVTGAIRGLLCYRCNIGIGNLGDDPDRLEAAARYLRRLRSP